MIADVIKPYALLAGALAWAGSLVAVGVWQRGDARAIERSAWEQRDNAARRAAAEKIDELHRQARQREAEHAARIAAIATDHQREITHAHAQRARDLAAARSGALVLRLPATGLRANSDTLGAPGAATCQRDDGAPGELPGALAADLFELAHDADDTARQLAAAQRVIAEDRRVCGVE